jgi:hypothetical protein
MRYMRKVLAFLVSVSILSTMALPIASSFAQMAPMGNLRGISTTDSSNVNEMPPTLSAPPSNQTTKPAYPQIIYPSKEMIDYRNQLFGYRTIILGNDTQGNASNISPAAFGNNKCVNWLQNINGTNHVYIQCTYDAGRSWSDPIQLTSRNNASNLVSCGSAKFFSNAWQELNQNTSTSEIWGTISFDGGLTFGAPEKLSPNNLNGSAHDPVMIAGDCEWVYYTITYDNGTSGPAAWPW